MNLWGKTQSDLDAERAEAIARREYLARRDAEAKDRLVEDFVRQAGPATAAPYGRSPGQLAMHYARSIDQKGKGREQITTIYFGQDVEGFDGMSCEVQSYEVDEYERSMRGEDDAGYGPRWVTGIALMLLVVLMIGVALVML